MVYKYILLIITGLSGGGIISAAIFALITSTGIITRMADKSHTAKCVRVYETAVVLGGIFFNFLWLLNPNIKLTEHLGNSILTIMGLCQGIFVGVLAVSLAEALNGTAIFARRLRLKQGLSFLVLSVAIGKAISVIIQFINGIVK